MSHQSPGQTCANAHLRPRDTSAVLGVFCGTQAPLGGCFAGHWRRLGVHLGSHLGPWPDRPLPPAEKKVPGAAWSAYDPVRGRLQHPAGDPRRRRRRQRPPRRGRDGGPHGGALLRRRRRGGAREPDDRPVRDWLLVELDDQVVAQSRLMPRALRRSGEPALDGTVHPATEVGGSVPGSSRAGGACRRVRPRARRAPPTGRHGERAVRQHRPRGDLARHGLRPERWSFLMEADLTQGAGTTTADPGRLHAHTWEGSTTTRCGGAQPRVRGPLRLRPVEPADAGTVGGCELCSPTGAEPARPRTGGAVAAYLQTKEYDATPEATGLREAFVAKVGTAHAAPPPGPRRPAAAHRTAPATARRASTGRPSTWTRRTPPAPWGSTSGPGSGPTCGGRPTGSRADQRELGAHEPPVAVLPATRVPRAPRPAPASSSGRRRRPGACAGPPVLTSSQGALGPPVDARLRLPCAARRCAGPRPRCGSRDLDRGRQVGRRRGRPSSAGCPDRRASRGRLRDRGSRPSSSRAGGRMA